MNDMMDKILLLLFMSYENIFNYIIFEFKIEGC